MESGKLTLILITDLLSLPRLEKQHFADKANFDPRHFNKPARKYMKQVCLDRYKQFWCEGQASKIKQNITNYYADLYAKGDLDPKVKATV